MAVFMNPLGKYAWSKNPVNNNGSYTLMLLFAWIKYLPVIPTVPLALRHFSSLIISNIWAGLTLQVVVSSLECVRLTTSICLQGQLTLLNKAE